MTIGPLTLFRGCVAAWHWGWSITWRWVFNIRRHNPGVLMGFHKQRIHQGKGWLIVWNTRLIDFSFNSQPNMDRREVELSLKYGRLLDKITGYVDD
jgi:hypothetical protein